MRDQKPSDTAPADSGDPAKKGEHAYLISIEKLIVHKYAAHAALLRKADKLAQQLIQEELREGEFVRVVKPGRYFLHFPKLRADARELRGSVIMEKIYRTIRELNPAAQHLDTGRDEPANEAPTTPSRPPVRPTSSPMHRPAAPPRTPETERDLEMKRISNAAISAMAGTGVMLQEELLRSPLGMALTAKVGVSLTPIWYAPKAVIIGHDCSATYEGRLIRDADELVHDLGSSAVETQAILDAIVYEKICALLEERLADKVMGLITCPVHASTLLHTKYLSPFLAAGSKLTDIAKNYLLFVVKDFTAPISRIKARDVVGYLRPRARALLAGLPVNAATIPTFLKELGFHGARAVLPTAVTPEAVLIKHLNTFAERCEAAKLQCTIDGLATKSLTVAATTAGFSYLSGPAIKVESGADLQEFDADSLFPLISPRESAASAGS